MARTELVPWRRVVLGTTLGLSSMAMYPVALSIVQPRSAQSISLIEGVGYLSLAILCLGLILVLTGANMLLMAGATFRTQENRLSSTLNPLALVLRDKFSTRVRLGAATGYAIFFALLSGMMVYQPNLNFSTLYGVDVPSSVVVVCCGPVGQIPQLVVYLTGHLALLVTPVTMSLLFTVSWLVGINLAVLAHAFRARQTNGRAGLLSGMGGVLGVLTACPACAGAFLTTVIGEAGALSVAALAAYQGLFIAASIPLLVIAPILTARRAAASLVTDCALSA